MLLLMQELQPATMKIIIKMFQSNKQHVEEKREKVYHVEILKHLYNILHIGYALVFD